MDPASALDWAQLGEFSSRRHGTGLDMTARTMTQTIRISLALALALTAACGKKSDDKSGGAAAKGTDKPAAAPVWKKVASMGIEVQVAPDADVQDNSASSGFPSSTIYSTDGTPTMFIFGAKDPADSLAISKDYDSTKGRVQKEMNGFKSFTKDEKGADGVGFELRYTGADMMEKEKTLYGITIRSKVGELVLDCSTNASSEAEIEQAAKLCKSIRAAK
jgi:hypothetical protein